MTPTVPIKQLSQTELRAVSMLAADVGMTVERTLGKRISETDMEAITMTVAECFSTGIRDGHEVYYTCLLHLPDFKDERDDVLKMLNAVRGRNTLRTH